MEGAVLLSMVSVGLTEKRWEGCRGSHGHPREP